MTAALVLLSMLGVTPGATSASPVRLLLLPPPPDADPSLRAVHDAVDARLAATPAVHLVPTDLLKVTAPPTDDGALAAEIDHTLSRVKDAYRRLDVDEATRLLQSLENARLNELGCPERIGLAGELSFWLGVVYAAKKDVAHATERFTSMLSIDPARPIDRAYFPPQTVAIFEAVRKKLAAAPTGGLSLSVEPEAAEVFLDGRPAGHAPVTLTASAGDHFVCVRQVGWKDWAARLQWTAGKVEAQKLYLQRAAGNEAGRQLAAVLDGKPPRLDTPAHVAALGAALGADVVAELKGASTLAWREVKEPAGPHEVSAPANEADPAATAAALADGLERGLGLVAAPAALEPALSQGHIELEVTAAGSLPFSLGKGGILGGQIGVLWYLHPAFGVGLHLGAGKSFSDLALHDTQGNPFAVAQGLFDASFSIDPRWSFFHTRSWQAGLEGGARLRLAAFGPAQSTPAGPMQAPMFTPIMGSPPPNVLLLGPHLGAWTTRAVTSTIGITLGFDYGAEFVLRAPEVAGTLTQNGNMMNLTLTSDTVRHVVSLDLGVTVLFE